MRRLYLQVYLAILAVLVVYALLGSVAWLIGPAREDQAVFEGVAALAAEMLPAGAPEADLQARLRRLGPSLTADLTLWSAEGRALASTDRQVPFPGAERTRSGWMRWRGGHSAALHLPDGRWLVAQHRHRGAGHLGVLAGLALLGLAVGIGAWPLARRLTRRLERLRAGVEKLGAGDLKARVAVEGRDEVATLAASFNRSADRIEALVAAQKALLAGASHELRSPLARIRLAVELLGQDRPDLRARLARDVDELDELIAELLLASRLESVEALERMEDVDLLGLAAEEAVRFELEAGGEPVVVRGDPRLLRRLVRNLLENARRHGAPPVEVTVRRLHGRALLEVSDAGPGIPEAERERVFMPFHQVPGRPASEGGSGLGLALVRQIAQRHGGTASYVPREGGGSVLRVDLPGS